MASISQQELVKLVSLYKAYCSGVLDSETIINEMLDIKVEIDRLTCRSLPTESLSVYYSELEYLLYDIMGYDKE